MKLNDNTHSNMFNLIKKSVFNKSQSEICNKNIRPSVNIPVEKGRRIIGLGDIHGDLKLALQCLVLAQVIPYDCDFFDPDIPAQSIYKKLSKIQWIGNNTIVVQVGDQIDRCRPYQPGQRCTDEGVTFEDEPSDIVILDFFTHLHLQAIRAGGMVISLYGNHEIMNISGKLSYVSKLGIEQFENITIDNTIIQNGLEARGRFFRKGGEYAKFLGCTRVSSVIVGSTLFAHAGVIERFMNNIDGNNASLNTIEKIDEAVQKWVLNEANGLSDIDIKYILESSDSLFWNRILGTLPSDIDGKNYVNNEDCKMHLNKVLKVLNLNRMVIGHTPHLKTGISPACNNTLFRIDIGASKAFKPFQKSFRYVQILEIIEGISVKPISQTFIN